MSVILGYKFAAIPESGSVYHPKLTGDDVRVFGVLARYGADIRPAQGTIASQIGKSADTVKRSLHRLVTVGAVYVEPRQRTGRRCRTGTTWPGINRSWMHPVGHRCAQGWGARMRRGWVSVAPYEREQENESKDNESSPASTKRRGPTPEGKAANRVARPGTTPPPKPPGRRRSASRCPAS